ncbi:MULTISPECIES: hypothetical protein [unclassified Burkholderia]|uniref:hypothetical protein n=1 Tax=unclassified Burkholderia TaxID=2613784 RepID=UPI00084CB0BE|nr:MULTISPECIES: hypothetical protein [unclassified Burkholderia]RQU17985.1 hypothetical protein DF152_11270 [Burkholderia cenocepacia]MBR8237779.1 hypothetical protein [Burkholderia sp. AU32357]MBY4877827.1 hypothetical protein [Burkholderia sp. AU42008]OED12748.1 hypothetical protein A9Z05_23515 [Burkholderia sp. A2]OXI37628.1 hypothetical protein CFB49_31735 [Burkholderia sp. AU17457]
MRIDQSYRRFDIAATLSPLPGNRAIAIVDVTTDDPGRVADLGTGQFLQIRKWLESNDIALLTVVFDECKVAIDHYADNVDDA